MKIRLSELPPEGLALTGVFERDIFQLEAEDVIQPAGAVSYDILVEADKDGLVLSGSLKAPMKLHCVRCMEEFPYTLKLNDYLSDFDLEEDLESAAEVDLGQLLREDLLLSLPAYPHCEEGDDPDHVCPREGSQHFETQAPAASDDAAESDQPPSQWSALDKLSDSDR